MKKIITFALLLSFALTAGARSINITMHIESATFYADLAKSTFDLSEEKRNELFDLKKEEYAAVYAIVKVLKDENKSDLEIQEKAKEVRKASFTKMVNCIQCSKTELNAFNKEFRDKMKEKRAEQAAQEKNSEYLFE